ncbi:helix-turn-helix transcriptional regulator [Hamadaea sp. NPDC050747]|uniref:helix-turn-helix domain-containing protein n=1 Tax=Hamadaea sp. NPDC050747 TaxID=3155789 RepID=UPI0033C9743C
MISEQTAAVIAQTPDRWTTYTQACQTLGARLAACRKDAGLTRKQLASALGRSLSTVRRAETGASHFNADFWRAADETLNTGGVLAAEWVRVAKHKQAAEAQYADKVALNEAAGRCLSPADCLCRVAVAHWTQREIRALRVALRFGFPQWASVMQTDLEAVYGWESPRGPLPSLEAQLQFDQLLARVDIDARARFRKLLTAPSAVPTASSSSPAVAVAPSGGQQ